MCWVTGQSMHCRWSFDPQSLGRDLPFLHVIIRGEAGPLSNKQKRKEENEKKARKRDRPQVSRCATDTGLPGSGGGVQVPDLMGKPGDFAPPPELREETTLPQGRAQTSGWGEFRHVDGSVCVRFALRGGDRPSRLSAPTNKSCRG